MRVLKTEFNKDGFAYAVLKRTEGLSTNVALLQQAKGGNVAFEVVLIQVHDARKIAGQEIPAGEALPANEDWGSKGWTFTERKRAEERYEKLVNKQTQLAKAQARAGEALASATSGKPDETQTPVKPKAESRPPTEPAQLPPKPPAIEPAAASPRPLTAETNPKPVARATKAQARPAHTLGKPAAASSRREGPPAEKPRRAQGAPIAAPAGGQLFLDLV